MKPLLLVKNDPLETLGVAPRALRDADAEILVLDAADRDAPRPRLEDISGIVMLGGTMNVDETDGHPFLKEDRDLAREAVERGVPYLGACLGAQILARALDAPVTANARREVGFEPLRLTESSADDPILSVWSEGDMAFQWHQDAIELPAEAELLASGDLDGVQAFRVGSRAWGTQFHFEIDAAELEFWLDEASEVMDLQEVWGKSAAEIRGEARHHLAMHEARGAEMFARFARIARDESH
jgi:GMP synthase (glutamine-hydrolysing)